jgi:hypothetical protein
MAAALLVTSVVAYLAMWAFGIGPVGSLVAQGIVRPGDTVVVATFANDTGDPSLGRRVRSLMEAELSRSALVHVFVVTTGGADGPTRSAETEAEILARRTGASIVVDGAILSIEGGYVVSARARLPDGTVVARFREVAEEHQGIYDKVALLSVRLRERMGESLRDIRATRGSVGFDPPG